MFYELFSPINAIINTVLKVEFSPVNLKHSGMK